MAEDYLNVESGDTNEVENATQKLIQQTIIKLSLRCEFCCVLNNVDNEKPISYDQEELKVVRLVLCKACKADGENQPQNKSYLVLCEPHWSECQEDLLKFNEVSQIRVEIFNPDIKRAKSINLSNYHSRRIIQEKNYCCKRLFYNYIAVLKTLYKVEGCDALKTIERVIQIRELQIRELEYKHNEYLKNKHQMSLKQKFLMLQQLKKQSQYEERDYYVKQTFISESNIYGESRVESLIAKQDLQFNQY